MMKMDDRILKPIRRSGVDDTVNSNLLTTSAAIQLPTVVDKRGFCNKLIQQMELVWNILS